MYSGFQFLARSIYGSDRSYLCTTLTNGSHSLTLSLQSFGLDVEMSFLSWVLYLPFLVFDVELRLSTGSWTWSVRFLLTLGARRSLIIWARWSVAKASGTCSGKLCVPLNKRCVRPMSTKSPNFIQLRRRQKESKEEREYKRMVGYGRREGHPRQLFKKWLILRSI